MPLIARRGHERIHLFSAMRPGRLLDFPAGGGEESRALAGMGFTPVLADLFRPSPKPSELTYVQADANDVFPFRNRSFDYVLSREGIEHLEYQAQFIRECARVLKPGGKLILTTPNVLHLNARLSFMLVGQRILGRGVVNELQTPRHSSGGKVYHGHAFLIDYFRLRYLMRMAGFDQIEVYTDRLSGTSIALAWIVPIMRLAFRLSIHKSLRHERDPEKLRAYRPVLKQIENHAFSSALLFGKRLMVTAVKTASAAAAEPERDASELRVAAR